MDLDKENIVKRTQSTYAFHAVGFHGDMHLIRLIDYIVVHEKINYFIETGTNVGATLSYFANKYPDVKCYSCEPDEQAYKLAVKNTETLENVQIYNLTTQDFLCLIANDGLDLKNKSAIYWLDAHGYGFDWPLKEEVEYFSNLESKGYMFIDDFKVPGNDKFGFDSYKGQICSYEYIKDSFKTDIYNIYYPSYSEKTSLHHPLRGWGLFTFNATLDLPVEIAGIVTVGA